MSVLTPQPRQSMTVWSSLCAQGCRHTERGLTLLVPVKTIVSNFVTAVWGMTRICECWSGVRMPLAI